MSRTSWPKEVRERDEQDRTTTRPKKKRPRTAASACAVRFLHEDGIDLFSLTTGNGSDGNRGGRLEYLFSSRLLVPRGRDGTAESVDATEKLVFLRSRMLIGKWRIIYARPAPYPEPNADVG